MTDRTVDTAQKEQRSIHVRPLAVLFVMRNLDGYLRYFASALELLTDRGHEVRLSLGQGRHSEVEQRWLEDMDKRPNFSFDIANRLTGSRWHRPAREIRRSLEYVRFLNPEFADRLAYRWRSSRRSSSFIQRLTRLPLVRTRRGIGLLSWILTVMDKAAPRPPGPGRYLDELRPDVLALCDYGHAGSLYSSYVEAAQARGIPAAICVASWDNLSTRQLYRVIPDALLVWNEVQVEEAITIHGMPGERIVVTGAQCFDHWFTWQPSPAAGFHARVGLDPERPYVLWVGGALNPADRSEPEYAREWLDTLRASENPALRDLGVLLRPHPKRVEDWLAVDYSELPGVAMWPRKGMTMPTDDAQRADYYDSIFYSVAVVGINSSAMIEAAIIGRPVLGLLTPEFLHSHTGTFHFSNVTEAKGGVVRAAGSIEEHIRQLEALLAGTATPHEEQRTRFLVRFLRPHGLDRPATPLFVDALERLAEAGPHEAKQQSWVSPARVVVAAGILVVDTWRAAAWFGWRRRRSSQARPRLAKLIRRRSRRTWRAIWKPSRRFLWRLRQTTRRRLGRLGD